jgi:hypothetical protein
MKKYPEEVRQKILKLVKSGTSKLEASRRFGIPYRTAIDWTLAIKQRKTYPAYLKKQARKLVRKGLTKMEVSRIIKVPYATVTNYTRDIKTETHGNARITGTTLTLLRELVAKGYAFDDRNPISRSSYKTLRQYFPVKTTKLHRVRIIYMNGNARKALEALLKKLNLRSIGYHELGFMKRAFGIKNIKRNNKIRERFLE